MFQDYHVRYVNTYQRRNMIERMRRNWIKGVLEPSLSGATFIPPGLYERPDLIDNLWKGVLLRKAGGGYTFLHKLLLEYFAGPGMREGTRGS